MKKTVLAVALTLVAAFAQAHGGPGGPGAAGAMGPGGPGAAGEMGPGGPGRDGGEVIVAADGTAFVTQRMSTGTNTSTEQLIAISPAGAIAWKITLDSSHHGFVLSGSNLLTVAGTAPTSTTAASSKITALSTASGATAWTLTVDGLVRELRPFNSGTYAVVVIPATTTGGTATRKLVAISNSGPVLWSVTLN
ncbi:MAG: hypothetical protein ABI837_21445 [Acidobacteriota bacterium]